jgi:DNA-directed RNA polymerase
MQRLINGGAKHVLHRVRTVPPTGAKTKKPHEMLEPRPPAPPRVVEAANKVQGTAWRINRAVLEALDSPSVRLAEPDLQREWILGEAQDLATLERFYFPVFLDFRGRLFQRGGVLTYTNAPDYARGLLEFADGERVDETGRNWLLWHAAQMWGRDLPYMPLGDGTYWPRQPRDRWKEAKYPAQFLAAMLAIEDADADRRVHLPVRVDATCSGLQHLALLSADEELARLVHLWGDYHGDRRGMNWLEIPTENFYQRVAESTGFDRDHVKAVIMPMLYGAGPETSAESLAEKREKRLSERQREDAKRIMGAAAALAPRAFGLLKWFGQVAKAHNDAHFGAIPIRWTTPSGFQAIQDYRYVEKNPTRPDRQVKIRVDDEWINPVKRFYTEDICPWQQVISMPSSIVHSLDAALLTEIVAGSSIDQWGVIHDAFAVPANRVWELLDRDNPRAMKALYEPDRLAEWLAAWRADGAHMAWCEELLQAFMERTARGPLPREMLGGLRTLG